MKHHENLDTKLREIWSESCSVSDQQIDDAFTALMRKVNPEPPSMTRSFLPYYSVAASIILLVGAFFGFDYYYSSQYKDALIEVSVPHGEIKELYLPDHTYVKLNAGSTLIYSRADFEENRLVFLTGEGYFKVSSDSLNPFFVRAAEMDVKAVGTEFNIRNYPTEDRLYTSLTEGVVHVGVQEIKTKQILSPGRQVVYDKHLRSLKVEDIDDNYMNAWQEGRLVFNGLTFSQILKSIERYYNVRVVCQQIYFNSDKFYVNLAPGSTIEQTMGVIHHLIPDIDYTLHVDQDNIKSLTIGRAKKESI